MWLKTKQNKTKNSSPFPGLYRENSSHQFAMGLIGLQMLNRLKQNPVPIYRQLLKNRPSDKLPSQHILGLGIAGRGPEWGVAAPLICP